MLGLASAPPGTASLFLEPSQPPAMSEDGTVGAGEDDGERTREDVTADGDGTTEDGYGGVLGTYPYAFRRSCSRLFRSYVLLGGLVTALIAVLFTFAVVGVVAETSGAGGGTFTFARSFVILLGFLVVIPLMAPVILVARRHRRHVPSVAYDRALAVAGYLFLASLYVGLLPTTPPDLRSEPPAALAPVVETLYGLPALAGVVPPLVALAVGYLLHRRYR